MALHLEGLDSQQIQRKFSTNKYEADFLFRSIKERESLRDSTGLLEENRQLRGWVFFLGILCVLLFVNMVHANDQSDAFLRMLLELDNPEKWIK